MPTLVASPELTRANARLQSGSLITDTLLGTPLGAFLFGVCATLPFAVDAVSFAAAAVLALTLSGDFRPRPQTTPNPWRRYPRHGDPVRADLPLGSVAADAQRVVLTPDPQVGRVVVAAPAGQGRFMGGWCAVPCLGQLAGGGGRSRLSMWWVW
ncbi:hypothetical protein ABZ725_28950 [Streptomyces sp. NPDC006872]|uniref:hypothetical protein n=1 Tax=Streptomyces sp. NPDC006872 TaxID=3155720 RepID=UPI0033E45FDA